MFKVVWGIDVVVALGAMLFFVWGTFDGSVSSFNIVLWAAILGGLALVVFGSRALFARGQRGLALALAMVPAIPAVGYAAMIGLFVASGTKWN